MAGGRWGRLAGGLCAWALLSQVGCRQLDELEADLGLGGLGGAPLPVFAPGTYCDPSPWGQWCTYNPNPSSDWWTAIGGAGPNELWVGGGSTGALHFDGQGWTRVDTGLAGAANFSVFALHNAWVAGLTADGRGAIAHFDGSAFTISFQQQGQFADIWGSGPDDIYAVSYGGAVHWNGVAWSPVAGVTGNSISGTGIEDVWVAQSDGLQHFDGAVWRAVPQFQGHYMIAVVDISWSDVWVADLHNGVTDLDHFDGASWTVAYSTGTDKNVYGLGAGASNDVWAVGQTYNPGAVGMLLHFDGQSWSQLATTPGAVSRMAAVGGNDLAVGMGGQILQLDAEGPIPVQNLTQGPAASLRGLWGSAPTDMWAVGDAGTALHYDGQAVWQSYAAGEVALNAVWGTGPQDVWIVGAGGTVLYYDGLVGRPVDVGTNVDLFAVFTGAPGDVWIGGDAGTLLHVIGGTVTPVELPRLPAGSPILVMHGISKNDIWLGGQSSIGGFVSHWDGTAWSPADFITGGPSAFHYPISRLWEVASNDVWVITSRGIGSTWEYLHFDGETWTDSQVPPSPDTWMFNGAEPNVANDSFAFNQDDVWSVGPLGAWRRRTPAGP